MSRRTVMAVLLRQGQWLLDEAAFEVGGGRYTAAQCRDAARSLAGLTTALEQYSADLEHDTADLDQHSAHRDQHPTGLDQHTTGREPHTAEHDQHSKEVEKHSDAHISGTQPDTAAPSNAATPSNTSTRTALVHAPQHDGGHTC